MRAYILCCLLICCLVPLLGQAQSSANYTITGGNLNSGGSVNMSSANYKATTTIGQSSPIGQSSSASYTAHAGVQYIYFSVVPAAEIFHYLLWTK